MINWPERLRRARLEKGLSQRQAARLVGVALGTWRSWETGVSRVTAHLLVESLRHNDFPLPEETVKRQEQWRQRTTPKRKSRPYPMERFAMADGDEMLRCARFHEWRKSVNPDRCPKCGRPVAASA